MELNINLSNADIKTKKQEKLDNITSTGRPDLSKDNASSKDVIKKAVGVNLAMRQVQRVSNQVISHKLSSAGNIYNDQARQNKINNVMSIGSRGSRTASALIGGGLVGGPVVSIIAGLGEVGSQLLEAKYKGEQWERNETENRLNETKSMESLGLTSIDMNRGGG